MMSQEYKWQRRERKQKSERGKMPKHGKGQAQMYADITQKRANEKRDVLNKIQKMLIKQNAMETASHMDLPTMHPNQMSAMTGASPQQAQQTVNQQQTANRSMAQQPQQPASTMSFNQQGAVSIPNEIRPKIDQYTNLDILSKKKFVEGLDTNIPQNYQIAKYIALRGDPSTQAIAVNKLNPDDLESLITPNTDNPDAVAVLALKTKNPVNWKLLSENTSPKVVMSLIRNPNVDSSVLETTYNHPDYGVRNAVVETAKDQKILHWMISDKNPNIRMKLIPKIDRDGLTILAKDDNHQVANFARKRLASNNKIENSSDDEFATVGDKHNKLPDYGFGSSIGAMGTGVGSMASMTNKSMATHINKFISKAEIEKEKLIAQSNKIKKEVGMVADTFTPTPNGGTTKKINFFNNKGKDLNDILNLVKSVGEEYFGE
jgi:hypothetical protein